MFEYGILNVTTDEYKLISGYNPADAFRRNPDLYPNDWVIIQTIYTD